MYNNPFVLSSLICIYYRLAAIHNVTDDDDDDGRHTVAIARPLVRSAKKVKKRKKRFLLLCCVVKTELVFCQSVIVDTVRTRRLINCRTFQFLADRTNGHAYATVLRPSSSSS